MLTTALPAATLDRFALPRHSRVAALDGVIQLAESCDYDADHAHHVAKLALAIFDDLDAIHQLDDEARFDLYAAALLHDIGLASGRKRHHKRSCELVLNSPLLPDDFFDARRRLRIGCVSRYHRKAHPAPHHRHFVCLEPGDRLTVRMLAGILRLADGLDKGHGQLVRELCCAATDRTVLVDCTVTDRERVLERIEPLPKRNLLAGVLRRRIHLAWHDA